jgi:hypothetical protein
MKKQQSNKKQSNGQNTKLYHKHSELGMTREFGKKQREYYTILTNGVVLDHIAPSPAQAKQFFQEESKLHDGEFTGKVRAYN